MLFRKILLCFLILIFSACDKKENTDLNNTNVNTEISKNDKFYLKLNNGDNFLINLDQNDLKLKDNKAVLFVFFTTWCEPCKAQIPIFNNLQEKYKDKLEIIGVLLEDKTKEEIDYFIEKNKIKYNISSGENNYLLAKKLGSIDAIPIMFLYKNNGKFVDEYLGIIPQEMLEIEIQRAI